MHDTTKPKRGGKSTLPASDDYRDYPAMRDYIDRVASEQDAIVDQRNFKRFALVRNEGKYKRDQYTITFADDGAVDAPREMMPTEEEAKALAAEFSKREFPKSIGAPNILKLKKIPEEKLFILWDRTRTNIIMCQERVDHEDGGKHYLPWTFFSDGRWRPMEPDHLLPLWKPPETRNKTKLMIHEGAKAAAFIDGLVNDITRKKELAAHPWAADLAEFEHRGWIGGAPNPHRTDWSEVLAEKDLIEIVLVADNDQVGIDAIPKISGALMRELKVITFRDHGFRSGFDLANEWPTEAERPKWWQGPRYIGPTFDDCIEPATWATDKVMPIGKGAPSYRIRPPFAAEWVVVKGLAEPLFIHRDQTYRKLSEKAFNVAVKPFSHVDLTARYLKSSFSSQVSGITYNPAHEPGVINVAGSQINTYRPPSIKAMKGDATPWTNFMGHLIPDEGDRTEVFRWVATFIARPDIRMLYALLLISENQGVGKGTLGYILAHQSGLWNTSFPSEEQIINPTYNAWIAHKRLAVVNEIYSGHSWKAYNKLKSTITDPLVDVSEKYLPTYTVDNWLQIIACSNSMNALRVDDDDRRWLIPRVTEDTKPTSYWKKFYAWLRVDGLGIIKSWAAEFLTTNDPVEQGDHAPDTTRKKQVISEGRSEGERIAFELGAYIAGLTVPEGHEPFGPEKFISVPDYNRPAKQTGAPDNIIIDLHDVRDLVVARRGLKSDEDMKKLEKPARLHKMLLAAGLHDSYRDDDGERHRFMIDNRKTAIVANFPIPKGTEWEDLKQYHVKLRALVPKWWPVDDEKKPADDEKK